MAIHRDIPGLAIQIRVAKQQTKEYKDDEAREESTSSRPAKRVSKYIKSIAGQEFVIDVSVCKPFVMDCANLDFVVSIDGEPIMSRMLPKEEHCGNSRLLINGINVREDNSDRLVFQPFRFSKIETTLDDDAHARVKADKERMANVGCIDVEVWRARKGRQVPYREPEQNIPVGQVHEKALKGEPKYHAVSLGNAKPSERIPMMWDAPRLGKHPMACFTFKYRSEQALKELMILKRTPEPEEPTPKLEEPTSNPEEVTPEPEDPIDLNQLDAEQKLKVEEFARSLLSGSTQGQRIKREGNENTPPSGSKKRRRRSGEKITIDLTDDD